MNAVLFAAASLLRSVAPTLVAAQAGSVTAPARSADAEAHVKRGEDRGHSYYWKGGNADRAIADLTRAIELRPNYPTAYNNRGVVYMAGGDAGKAIPEFDRALALNPNYRNAYINRANARLRLLQVGAALDDFHRVGMHPERVAAVMLALVVLLTTAAIAVVRRLRGARHRE